MSDKKLGMGNLIRLKEEKKEGAGVEPKKKKPKGKRKLKGFYIGPEYARAFDILKAETGIAGSELAEEALNLLFEKYGKDSLKD